MERYGEIEDYLQSHPVLSDKYEISGATHAIRQEIRERHAFN